MASLKVRAEYFDMFWVYAFPTLCQILSYLAVISSEYYHFKCCKIWIAYIYYVFKGRSLKYSYKVDNVGPQKATERHVFSCFTFWVMNLKLIPMLSKWRIQSLIT